MKIIYSRISFVLFAVILSIGSVKGQTDEFYSYFQKTNKEISNCFSGKDFHCVTAKLREVETKYLTLDQNDRNKYSGLLSYIYYNMTCVYALTGKVDNAITAFDNAIKNGYVNYNHARTDTDLDSLRENQRFKDLLASIREKGDYIYILQKAGPYTQEPPVFTYQAARDPELLKLKEYFNLDSIAGKGDEVSRILNLMTWAHNLIRHDGNYMPPVEKRTAISFYEYVKANDKGMNCRAMAIFLNECYLAMGFKSRFVTCLPKNEDDQDCHVINNVYSTSLKKWVWVDPTFNAYVKDEKGNMLSIPEVRQRLIDNKPVFINDDANWNNQNQYTKEMYIDGYMAKNLYWFICTTDSKIDSDMIREYNSKVSLVPLGYYQKNRDSLTYYSHDEDYFWENE